jgi:hypothetical protein
MRALPPPEDAFAECPGRLVRAHRSDNSPSAACRDLMSESAFEIANLRRLTIASSAS